MGQVRLEGYLEVPRTHIDEVKSALPAHIALTRAEAGCLRFEVIQNPVTPEHFMVSELFVDQAAFDRHQARVKASAWAGVTAGMARHYSITVDD